MSEREIAEASLLLMAEFPDMQQSVIVQALRETASLGECDIPAARRALYAMDAQQQVAQQQQQQRAQGPAAAPQVREAAYKSAAARRRRPPLADCSSIRG